MDLTIPDHPGAVSIELLRRRDVLTGQIFALADLLAPLVGSHDTPDLYPFQVEGIAWLTSGHRRLLADDMGLGKTVQAICAAGDLLRRGEIRFALVVCPKTLVLNWISEFNRWDSKLAVTALLPGGRTAHSVWQHQLHRTHVVVTSYDQLRDHHDTMVLQAQLLITDEAHRLRNLSSGVSKAIRALNPRYFWMLTGTPVERDNLDMASLLSILAPAQFTKSLQHCTTQFFAQMLGHLSSAARKTMSSLSFLRLHKSSNEYHYRQNRLPHIWELEKCFLPTI